MNALFKDLPHAIDNSGEIVDKIEELKLSRDILLPNFPLPSTFTDSDEYLRHLTFEGAHKRYSEVLPEIDLTSLFPKNFCNQLKLDPSYFNKLRDFLFEFETHYQRFPIQNATPDKFLC